MNRTLNYNKTELYRRQQIHIVPCMQEDKKYDKTYTALSSFLQSLDDKLMHIHCVFLG